MKKKPTVNEQCAEITSACEGLLEKICELHLLSEIDKKKLSGEVKLLIEEKPVEALSAKLVELTQTRRELQEMLAEARAQYPKNYILPENFFSESKLVKDIALSLTNTYIQAKKIIEKIEKEIAFLNENEKQLQAALNLALSKKIGNITQEQISLAEARQYLNSFKKLEEIAPEKLKKQQELLEAEKINLPQMKSQQLFEPLKKEMEFYIQKKNDCLQAMDEENTQKLFKEKSVKALNKKINNNEDILKALEELEKIIQEQESIKKNKKLSTLKTQQKNLQEVYQLISSNQNTFPFSQLDKKFQKAFSSIPGFSHFLNRLEDTEHTPKKWDAYRKNANHEMLEQDKNSLLQLIQNHIKKSELDILLLTTHESNKNLKIALNKLLIACVDLERERSILDSQTLQVESLQKRMAYTEEAIVKTKEELEQLSVFQKILNAYVSLMEQVQALNALVEQLSNYQHPNAEELYKNHQAINKKFFNATSLINSIKKEYSNQKSDLKSNAFNSLTKNLDAVLQKQVESVQQALTAVCRKKLESLEQKNKNFDSFYNEMQSIKIDETREGLIFLKNAILGFEKKQKEIEAVSEDTKKLREDRVLLTGVLLAEIELGQAIDGTINNTLELEKKAASLLKNLNEKLTKITLKICKEELNELKEKNNTFEDSLKEISSLQFEQNNESLENLKKTIQLLEEQLKKIGLVSEAKKKLHQNVGTLTDEQLKELINQECEKTDLLIEKTTSLRELLVQKFSTLTLNILQENITPFQERLNKIKQALASNKENLFNAFAIQAEFATALESEFHTFCKTALEKKQEELCFHCQSQGIEELVKQNQLHKDIENVKKQTVAGMATALTEKNNETDKQITTYEQQLKKINTISSNSRLSWLATLIENIAKVQTEEVEVINQHAAILKQHDQSSAYNTVVEQGNDLKTRGLQLRQSLLEEISKELATYIKQVTDENNNLQQINIYSYQESSSTLRLINSNLIFFLPSLEIIERTINQLSQQDQQDKVLSELVIKINKGNEAYKSLKSTHEKYRVISSNLEQRLGAREALADQFIRELKNYLVQRRAKMQNAVKDSLFDEDVKAREKCVNDLKTRLDKYKETGEPKDILEYIHNSKTFPGLHLSSLVNRLYLSIKKHGQENPFKPVEKKNVPDSQAIKPILANLEKNNPEYAKRLKELYKSVRALRDFAKSCKSTLPRSEDQHIASPNHRVGLEIADHLEQKLNSFLYHTQAKKSSPELDTFAFDFRAELHSYDDVMSEQTELWEPLVFNVSMSLLSILTFGAAALVRLGVTYYNSGYASFFYKSQGQCLVDSVENNFLTTVSSANCG